jgi:hypothetical protein
MIQRREPLCSEFVVESLKPCRDMTGKPEFHGLIGTQIMTAISVLASMGFRCTDISKQAPPTALNSAGTFSCTAIVQSEHGATYTDILLPFSEHGVVMDVIHNERTSQP